MNAPIASSAGPVASPQRPARGTETDPRQNGPNDTFLRILTGQGESAYAPARAATSPAAGDLTAVLTGLEGGIELDGAGQRFNLALTTAGRAIAFDARPIVAPVSVDLSPLAAASPDQHLARETPGRLATAMPGSGSFPNNADLRIAVGINSGGAGRTADSPPPTRSDATAPESRQTTALDPVRPGAADSAGESPEAGPDLQQDGDYRPLTGRSRQLLAHQVARGQMLANLLASTEDYRVLVRGVRLDLKEERALASAVRNALRDYGLPDRPVVIGFAVRES